MLSPEQLLVRLRQRLDLLCTAASDVPLRHQSLRNMVGWSYSLLPANVKALLTQIAVFEGGFTLDAAEAVTNTVDEDELVPGLAVLVDHHLLVREHCISGEWQFRLLETVRTFALEQLVTSGETAAVHRRHAAYYANLAETAAAFSNGPAQVRWLERIEQEQANVLSALHWAIENGEAELGLRLGGALWRYWWIRGETSVTEDLLKGLVFLSESVPPSAQRAKGLLGAGALAYRMDDYVAAQEIFQRSFTAAKKVGDRGLMAQALLNAGHAAHVRGDDASAEDWCGESHTLFTKEGLLDGQADALHALARVAQRRGDWDRTEALSREALQLYRQLGDQRGMAQTLHSLGQCAGHMGDRATAMALYEQSATLFGTLDDRSGKALALTSLAEAAGEEGDYGRAHRHLSDALAEARAAGNRRQIALSLVGCAALAAAKEQPVRALRLAGAATTILEELGVLRSWRSATAITTLPVSRAEQLLGQETAAAVFTLGRALSLDEAVSEALKTGGAGGTAQVTEPAVMRMATPSAMEPPTPDHAHLTRREREIASLVTEGFTNRQIAKELVLSERTVDTHVEHILKKLEVRSRAQVAAWVVQQEMSSQLAS